MAHLIEPIQWSRDENTGIARHRRRAAKLGNRHFETVPSLPQCSIVTFVCHLVNLKANFSLFIWHVESTSSYHSTSTWRPFRAARNLKVVIRRSASMSRGAALRAGAEENQIR